LRVKIIDVSNKNYKVITDTECPISKNAYLTWASYSEEGMLFTFDSDGILRTLNPFNK
jgi:hypothetical protein